MSSSSRNTGTGQPPAPLGTSQWRKDVVHRYVNKDHPIRRIAADLRCSYGAVHRALALEQVQMRPCGGARRRTGRTTPTTSTRRAATTESRTPSPPSRVP